MKSASHKSKLNDKQTHLLKLLYKFRFVTASLLSSYKAVSVWSINKSLNVLLDRGYLGRHYSKDYKIKGKGASYYLLPKALTYLRDNFQVNPQVLHAMYKNKTVSQGFIDHNLAVLAAYLALNSNTNYFHIFTKTELADYSYFPEPKPDLYLNRKNTSTGNKNEYMLDIFVDTQLFVIKKRFAALLEHYESGDWEAETENSYPVILFVLPDSKTEAKVQEHIAKVLDSTGIDDLKVYTTTAKALSGLSEDVWSDCESPEKLLSLV